MTKLNKTLLYLGLPVLAAIISIPFLPEQYGDSYNELQRKIWNERRALWERGEFVGSYTSPPPHIEKQIKRKRKLSERLRDSSAPDWTVAWPASPDFSKLPLEGMTSDELLHHAERNKDPDAWLLLLSSSSMERFPSNPNPNPTKLELLFMKKWVTKANELNRAGSRFLLRAIDKREATLTLEDREKDAAHHLKTIEGYMEFEQLISSGDFPLYKALVEIWPGIHKTSLSHKLEATLENKARHGDTIAQRQLGEYGFLHPKSIGKNFEQERNRPRPQWILWLSKQAEQWCPNLVTIRTTMDTSPSRNKLNEYAIWLKKAANAGDLAAMQLWLKYGVTALNYCSKKDWNDILLYSNILLEAGYGKSIFYWTDSGSDTCEIIRLSYSLDSQKKLAATVHDMLFARGSTSMIFEKLSGNKWEEQTKEYNLNLLDKVQQSNPAMLLGLYYGSVYLELVRQIKDEDVKQRYVGIIRKIANEGEPQFMVALADMIRKNLVKPNDPQEATRLLENTWPLCPKYNRLSFSDSEYLYLSELVVDHLMAIYLLECPTPENQQKALELAQQYNALNHTGFYYSFLSAPEHTIYFYLSLMYQKGYGVPRDPDRSKDYYEQSLKGMRQIILDREEKEQKLKSLMEQFDYNIPE